MHSIRIFVTTCALTILSAKAEMICKETDDHLVITREGKHVLTYHKTAKTPSGIDPKYARSGFIHPISTPSGRIITDDYPVPHHAHQHGLFFAWRSATFKGEKLNFWEHGKATVRHEKVLELINKEDHAGFRAELAHVNGDQKILREIWTVKVSAKTGHIDFKSEQTNLTSSPLTLNIYHYGGMAFRGSRQWFPDAHTSAGKGATKDDFVAPCKMITSDRLTQADGNHSRPTWVCMTGQIDKDPVSITFIPHPTNFRYPQHVRLHPKMPYFCFIPTVEEPFEIKAGKPWISRYRILPQDGKPDPKKLFQHQIDYSTESS